MFIRYLFLFAMFAQLFNYTCEINLGDHLRGGVLCVTFHFVAKSYLINQGSSKSNNNDKKISLIDYLINLVYLVLENNLVSILINCRSAYPLNKINLLSLICFKCHSYI